MRNRIGKVTATFTLWNLTQEKELRSGKIHPLEEECVVDTGAWTTVIPLRIAEALGLIIEPTTSWVTFADGRKRKRRIAAGLRVGWHDRRTVCVAIIEPGRNNVLVGQLVLEGMDLLVDCKRQKVIPRTPGEPIFEILQAGA